MKVASVLRQEISLLDDDSFSSPLTELGLDSFDLVSLRASIESAIGREIADAGWMRVRTPADIVDLCERQKRRQISQPAPAAAVRRHVVNMPQMAIGGLSEAWLFKEIGDFHWNLISDGLGMKSSEIFDGDGNRLYATFTRIRMRGDANLRSFRENEALEIRAEISRYGAGIFLGRFIVTGDSRRISFDVMSSFSKRSRETTNQDLMKGQPAIRPDCPIRPVPERPAFCDEYRFIRAEQPPAALFEREYRINPYTDINGVGLVYFAAFPVIADTCELDYFGEGNRWAQRASTVSRDVFYFANSDADEPLIYSVLSKAESDGIVELDSMISRKACGTPMARMITRKAAVV